MGKRSNNDIFRCVRKSYGLSIEILKYVSFEEKNTQEHRKSTERKKHTHNPSGGSKHALHSQAHHLGGKSSRG